MKQTRKNPRAGGLSQGINSDKTDESIVNNPLKTGKLNRMLSTFAAGARLHRFDAEHLGDHCLHTSVSDLQLKHGIRFEREWVKVQNRFGGETRVMMYWLQGDYKQKARLLCGLDQRC